MSRSFFALMSLALVTFVGVLGCEKPRPPQKTVVVAVPKPPTRHKVLVLPLACMAKESSLCAVAMGLPIVLAERLEADPGIEPINGRQVFTSEQGRLLPAPGAQVDLVAANALALSKGASNFVTGALGGSTRTWTYEIRIYAVGKDAAKEIGSNGAVIGGLEGSSDITTKPSRGLSGVKLVETFAEAVTAAFENASMPLDVATATALTVPDTKDGYGFLLFSRAAVVWFGTQEVANMMRATETDQGGDAALALAGRAMNIDPRNTTARRFYAELLLERGNTGLSRVHLEIALKQRPGDLRARNDLSGLQLAERKAAEVKDLLVQAAMDGQELSAAISFSERARDILPKAPEPRWTLVDLYADAGRYVDAAREAEALTGMISGDIRPWYLWAANLRAAGMRDAAVAAYEKASVRYPHEHRLHLYRGDLLREEGREAEAVEAYRVASSGVWRNERLNAMLAKAPEPYPAGSALAAVIKKDAVRLETVLALRTDYNLGVNDAVLDLRANGEQACKSGAGASSARFAREKADMYLATVGDLTADGLRLDAAFADGEHRALTTDELKRARRIVEVGSSVERDWREMRTVWERSFLPAYAKAECETYDGEIEGTTRERIRERLEERVVKMPDAVIPPNLVAASPTIPARHADMITFAIDNREGRLVRQVWIDGTMRGFVESGSRGSFTAPKGPHTLCTAPLGNRCGDPGTLRNKVNLSEPWTLTMRPGG